MSAATKPAWDSWDASVADEVTKDTALGHAVMMDLLRAQLRPEEPWEYAVGGPSLRIRLRGYVAEVRGQSSVTGHGMQGADPGVWRNLREIEEPVLIVFVESGGHKMEWVWLDAAPPIRNISNDPGNRRQGWYVWELNRSEVADFRFPGSAPPRDPATHGRLL